jgi:hypothetical protein
MNNYDGSIVIGTELNTKDFDKKYAELLRRQEKEEIDLNVKTENFEKMQQDLENLKLEYEKFLSEVQENPIDAEGLPINDDVVDNLVTKQWQDYETKIDRLTAKLEKQRDAVAKQKNEYNEIIQKVNDYEASLNKADFSQKDITKGIDNIGKNLKQIIKRTIQWGLAIFGIRSAYIFIRQSMSTLSQYDEKLAADLEYIRYALASAIEPIIRKIIELVYKLLGYLGYLVKTWTGRNIFASANKGLDSANKKAKELKKQLAGFDEMNVLNDSSAGDDSGAMPSVDLSKIQGNPPKWLERIGKNGKELLALILGLIAGLESLKLGIGGLKALGIGMAIAGIIYSIQGLLGYLKEPTWKNFGKTIQGIGVAIAGVGIIVGGLPAIIVGAIVLIWGTIVKYWDKIQAFLQKGIDWLSGKSDWIHNKFGNTIGNIYDLFVRQLQRTLDWFSSTMTRIKANFDEIISFVKNVFAGNWKAAWENVKNIFANIWGFIKDTFGFVLNSLIDKARTIGSSVGNVLASAFKSVINGILRTIETMLNSPIRAVNSLINLVNKLPGINLGKIPTFNLPRLAKGGIINMPGRGVPVGNAIGGERGQEGVIPLTDSQQMALLGEAIGKYVTINATIPVYAYNRVVDRQIKRIKAEDDFAYNR